jgi:hypothetical protein
MAGIPPTKLTSAGNPWIYSVAPAVEVDPRNFWLKSVKTSSTPEDARYLRVIKSIQHFSLIVGETALYFAGSRGCYINSIPLKLMLICVHRNINRLHCLCVENRWVQLVYPLSSYFQRT